MKTLKKKSTFDIAEMVTSIIISKLEEGVVPWRKTWKGVGLPKNYLTGKTYRGINLIVLYAYGHEIPQYLTFKQIETLGGKVRKEACSIQVVYWNYCYRNKESGKKVSNAEAMKIDPEKLTKTAFLKYYRVFNVSDCENISFEDILDNGSENRLKIQSCETVLENMPNPPKVLPYGNEAFYNPKTDEIHIPPINKFDSPAAFYNVLFHEIIHASGHKKRLNRESVSKAQGFGSESYSKEELIAEMGAGILAGYTGISDDLLISNSASYIQSWLSKLSSDKNMLFDAAGKAQKAVDYILDICPF